MRVLFIITEVFRRYDKLINNTFLLGTKVYKNTEPQFW